ncbi:sulfate permease [Microbacterium sp. M3]|uniref:Sulfate permease n=1 Tax=Microbacterium arthrosphaerae TaxID=792652 RepID=A0ABU4GZX5_9MICO|nr:MULTISPECIES: sulfate permease [Microbacterium]MDW4572633.1 sulfate permease [Microbacterium arthrosphaerae]MDW7606488.1 sulfate permease [Microbacterium sp. M3]
MPTNILLAAIFTRRGLKWGVPAMLIAVLYFLAAALCAGLVERGAAGWLNLVVLLFLWNALKFVAVGPASLVCLLRVRMREAQVRRLTRVAVMSDGVPLERTTRAPARVLH